MTGVVLNVPSLLRPESEQVRMCLAGVSAALCARAGSRFRRMWRLLRRKYPRSRSFVDLRKRRLLCLSFSGFCVFSEIDIHCKQCFKAYDFVSVLILGCIKALIKTTTN